MKLLINTISNYNNYSISCNGLADGSVNISITGGVGPFNVKWNNINNNSTYIDSLSQGIYQLEIEDSLGCKFNEQITINEPSQISIIETHEDASCYGFNDGSLSLSINGGIPSYSISGSIISPSVNSDTISINNIFANTQNFTIIDQNNCIYNDSIIILVIIQTGNPGISQTQGPKDLRVIRSRRARDPDKACDPWTCDPRTQKQKT